MRILVVCTANICRSASAERLLRDAIAASPELGGLEVRSAGTYAIAGAPGCHVAPALAGRADEHRSKPLTPDLLDWADLVLTAEREHRTAVASLLPTSLRRVFTLRQAGRAAQWIVDSGMVEAAQERAEGPDGWRGRFPEGDPRGAVGPMPGDPAQRGRWVVDELDAARGMVAVRVEQEGSVLWERGGRFWRRRSERGLPHVHSDDVPDPHVLGMELHEAAYEAIVEALRPGVELLRMVAPG